MKQIVTILLVLAMLATAVVLILGLSTAFKPGHANAMRSNALMRWRVTLQGLALLFFALLLYLGR